MPNKIHLIEIKNKALTPIDWRMIYIQIEEHREITQVSLTGLAMNQEHLELILPALLTLKLTHLNLAGNALDDASTDLLKTLLWHHPALTHLNLGSNRFSSQFILAITPLLHEHSPMLYFNMSDNPIDDQGIYCLVTNKNLLDIRLLNMHLSRKVKQFIVDTLSPQKRMLLIDSKNIWWNSAPKGLFELQPILSKVVFQNNRIEPYKQCNYSSNRWIIDRFDNFLAVISTKKIEHLGIKLCGIEKTDFLIMQRLLAIKDNLLTDELLSLTIEFPEKTHLSAFPSIQKMVKRSPQLKQLVIASHQQAYTPFSLSYFKPSLAIYLILFIILLPRILLSREHFLSSYDALKTTDKRLYHLSKEALRWLILFFLLSNAWPLVTAWPALLVIELAIKAYPYALDFHFYKKLKSLCLISSQLENIQFQILGGEYRGSYSPPEWSLQELYQHTPHPQHQALAEGVDLLKNEEDCVAQDEKGDFCIKSHEDQLQNTMRAYQRDQIQAYAARFFSPQPSLKPVIQPQRALSKTSAPTFFSRRAHDTFNDFIQHELNLGVIVDNRGGGDCQFIAIAEQLLQIYPEAYPEALLQILQAGPTDNHSYRETDEKFILRLRALAVQQIRATPRLKEFINPGDGGVFASTEDYLQKMSKLGFWGDLITLKALAFALKIPILNLDRRDWLAGKTREQAWDTLSHKFYHPHCVHGRSYQHESPIDTPLNRLIIIVYNGESHYLTVSRRPDEQLRTFCHSKGLRFSDSDPLDHAHHVV